jgi:anaphase-promoting complex subunit 8
VFEDIRAADPYRLQHLETYSNILYVKEKNAELSHLAHTVVKIEKYAPESCCVIGNYYSLKAQHERAILYFQRALKLNPRYLSAWTLMGHEFVELRNTAAAVQCYRRAVDVSPTDYRAWYGLGQTYEMLHLYQYALYYYKKAAFLKSGDARMWCAVGNCYTRLGWVKDAISALERAVGAGDKEGVATRELARLYRETGQPAKAAASYFKHLQLCGISLPDLDGDVQASFLGHSSLQEEGIVIDDEKAKGLLFLATFYRSAGDWPKAEFFSSK